MENRLRYFVVFVYLLIQSCGSFRHPYVNNRHKIIFYVSDSFNNYIAKQIEINEYNNNKSFEEPTMTKNHLICVEIECLVKDAVNQHWPSGEHEVFYIEFFDASRAQREYKEHKHDINHLHKNIPEMLSNRYLSIGNKLYPIYISSLDDYFDSNNPKTRNESLHHSRPYIATRPMLIYYYDRLSKGFIDLNEANGIIHGLKK